MTTSGSAPDGQQTPPGGPFKGLQGLQGINFNLAYSKTKIPVTARAELGGRTWYLRPEVPAELMVAYNLKPALERRIAAALAAAMAMNDLEQRELARAAFAAEKSETLDLASQLFQHTYPETTPDDVARQFSYEEQVGILEFFMALRSSGYTRLLGVYERATTLAAELGRRQTAQGQGPSTED